jgi:hypothetical protein
MKLNWGHKIAIVYTLFAGFMIVMLLKSRQFSHELVTEQYYQAEMGLQADLNANANLHEAEFKVWIEPGDGQIEIRFTGLEPGVVPTGEIGLYRPDDAALDETHALHLDTQATMVLIPKAKAGRYQVSVRFEINGESYFKQQNLVL